jgi:pimeloyl-ACP methyl ester carboxylesterase
MAGMAGFLRDNGFGTLNLDYRSRHENIETLARDVAEAVNRSSEACRALRLHFVTHSMGGLVTRRLVLRFRPANLGRVVMLAPPNRGSEIADRLSPLALYRFAYGPAGQELTTRHQALTYPEGDVDFDLAVIAGANGANPFGKLLISGPHDGTVSVESTKLPGTKDHYVLPVSHTFIMDAPEARRQTLAFLKNGRFEQAPDSTRRRKSWGEQE